MVLLFVITFEVVVMVLQLIVVIQILVMGLILFDPEITQMFLLFTLTRRIFLWVIFQNVFGL